MSLFDFLKAELRARDWSMTDLARRAGCSKQIVSQWLAEDQAYRITPSPASCKKIAEALGLDVDYVLELAGHRKARPDELTRNPKLSAVIALIESAFHLMTPQEWELREPVARQLFSVPTHAGPVTSAHNRRVTDPKPAANRPAVAPVSDLPKRQHARPLPRLAFAGAV